LSSQHTLFMALSEVHCKLSEIQITSHRFLKLPLLHITSFEHVTHLQNFSKYIPNNKELKKNHQTTKHKNSHSG